MGRCPHKPLPGTRLGFSSVTDGMADGVVWMCGVCALFVCLCCLCCWMVDDGRRLGGAWCVTSVHSTFLDFVTKAFFCQRLSNEKPVVYTNKIQHFFAALVQYVFTPQTIKSSPAASSSSAVSGGSKADSTLAHEPGATTDIPTKSL